MNPHMSAKQILLVEDNPDDAELTLLAFKQCRIANEVVLARDGVEALEMIFGKTGDRPQAAMRYPSLILLDLKLPRVNGLQVLARLRADPATRRIPVVMLTSSVEQEDVLKSYDLGANSYVRKPVDFEHFTEAVHQLGFYWLLLNESPPVGVTA